MATSNPQTHKVIVSRPQVGHIVSRQSPSSSSLNLKPQPANSRLSNQPGLKILVSLKIIQLPPLDISGKVKPNSPIFTTLTTIMRETNPLLRSAISALKPRPTALFVNIFGIAALDVVEEYHMLKYVFVTTTLPLALAVYIINILDKEVEGEYVDQKEPLRLPGCMPVRPDDVVVLLMNRTKHEYRVFLQVGLEIRRSDGLMVNMWEDLDTKMLKAMREEECYDTLPVYPVGPLFRPVEQSGLKSELLDWLDKQPVESVIYVSFGVSGKLSAQQITELAWVVESIISGVPMIAWPLYAEHKMNAVLLAEELRVVVRPKIAPTKGVVGREEIEMMIRKVMEDHEEGKAMRARIK
ncbi:anthocyanidin 3-o-glucosyltransferase 5 [Quercus suber]|uniref:Anthocyanidin 3-o-glucosyltransferase 5 n=1 Tax=Quercus suber TaxID=58331 RepID=A0AAW0KTX0_QUESU